MHAVILPVGADLYAVPINWVRQVLIVPQITVLVTAPAVVLGLFNVRGEIVPLLDTAALLGIGSIDAAEFAVVLHGPDGSNSPVALAATAIPERITLDTAAAPSALPGTCGTFYVDRRVVVLLDPGVLMASARPQPLAEPHAAVVA